MEISLKKFKEKLPDTTERELKENEKLCNTCGGLGLTYKNSFVRTCPDCRGGKIRICEFCGEDLKNNYQRCNCDEAKAKRQKERIEAALKRKEKATEVSIDYIIDNDLWLYDDINKEYHEDIEGVESDWVFTTKVDRLSLNAEYIMENALEELHESVYDSVDWRDYEKLQKVCDEINEKYKDYKTYYPDFSKWVDLK